MLAGSAKRESTFRLRHRQPPNVKKNLVAQRVPQASFLFHKVAEKYLILAVVQKMRAVCTFECEYMKLSNI